MQPLGALFNPPKPPVLAAAEGTKELGCLGTRSPLSLVSLEAPLFRSWLPPSLTLPCRHFSLAGPGVPSVNKLGELGSNKIYLCRPIEDIFFLHIPHTPRSP